ncbi:GDP-L-fucose synthase, partial [Streptomyces anulatus]
MTTELPAPSRESARPLLRPGSRIFVAGHRGLVGAAGGPPRADQAHQGVNPRPHHHHQPDAARTGSGMK